MIIGTSLKNSKEKFVNMFISAFGVEPKVSELETKTKFILEGTEFIDTFYEFENKISLNEDLDYMAFVAGSFVAKGWVSKPSSRFYHLEFRVGSMEHSLNLQEAIDSLGIKTKFVNKGKWFITYVKKSMDLSDLLRAMQATQSMMIFEDERITRDISSSYSKMETIEAYNIKKIESISKSQIEAIKKLENENKLSLLGEDKLAVAKIRLNNPAHSLSDIQYTFNAENDKNVSKSTINNWFKYIIDLSK